MDRLDASPQKPVQRLVAADHDDLRAILGEALWRHANGYPIADGDVWHQPQLTPGNAEG